MPAAQVAKNYNRVDRGADYSPIDFAELTLDRLPARAVVLTDSWTAPPLWYAQLVRGERTDVGVSPIFSVQGADVVAFAQKQLADNRPVYVAEGLRTPLGELKAHYTLQPVMLDSIERMLVDVLPKPQYRDDLVATGSLYRVLPTPPNVTVEAVPPGTERDIAFETGVTLAGFALDGDIVDRGGAIELTNYWRADAHVAHDLRAVTLFFDPHGGVDAVQGYPVWWQSRLIGQGVLQTSAWKPGEIIKESYFALVPRTLAPGEYDIRIGVDDPGSRAARYSADPASLETIGHIAVR
jgi:hypothetical protein